MKSTRKFIRIAETYFDTRLLINPQLSEQMKKKGKDVSPEDYRKLLREINNLKAELKKEKLRADFYEEMVAFGEEVYGMDLKKAGIK